MAVPLLFLDVDGPIIPYGLPAGQHATYPDPLDDGSDPFLARVNPEHGVRLAALPCEVVWATARERGVYGQIAPRLGLAHIEVVTWPDVSEADEERGERIGLHWKTRALIEWAAGRPFAWVDDEITDTDREWVDAYHPGPALLHYVDPRRGLADADFAVLGEWLRAFGDGPARA